MPHIELAPSTPSQGTIVEIDPKLLEELQDKISKQIVETEKSDNTQEPKDAKYLGERSQTVEKEMKAKTVDSFKSGAPHAGKTLSLKNLAPQKDYMKPVEQGDYALRKKQSIQEPKEKGSTAAATNDYLKDTADGDRTLLNTKEFIYFGYYHRIREKLEQSWNNRLRTVLMDYIRSGRRLTNDRNYVTRLVVVLDGNGKIRAVKIIEESGARDLDDAAVDAFNRAGPFPNPPKGLIEKDGLIKIRWDFILQS